MRLLVQRVSQAWVTMEGTQTPEAGRGLLVLVGFTAGDHQGLLEPLADKVVHLRVFPDGAGRMNLGLLEVAGDLVLVPQFTLYADCSKGRRPSFFQALEPQAAAALFEQFVAACRRWVPQATAGKFGADMQVHLVNDGPVTLWLDSAALRLERF